MPKRKRGYGYTSPKARRFRKKAKNQPRRAYKGSMVPLRSGGYNFDAPELKFFDTANAIHVVGETQASLTAIFTPSMGTAMTDRIGTRVKVKSINVKGWISNSFAYDRISGPADAMIPPVLMKLSIVLDMQPNGANPLITDIYTTTQSDTNLNLYNRDRFKVLKEKTFMLDPYILNSGLSLASTVNVAKQFKIYKKCDLPVFFNSGNAGTVADIASNNILMVWQSDCPAHFLPAGTQAKTITRIRFVDP